MISSIDSTIMVAEAMRGFNPLVAPITAMSYATDNSALSLGDIVKVPYATSNSSDGNFDYSTGYAGDSTILGVRPVTLNNLVYQKFTITDTDASKLTPQSILTICNQAGQKLAGDVVSASLASVISDANYPLSASCTSNQLTSSLAIADLVTQADKASWTLDNRNLILGPDAYNSLIKNPTLNQAFSYGGAQVVQDDKPTKVNGFNIYKTNVTLPNNCKGLVLNPNAILTGFGQHKVANVNGNNYVTQTNYSNDGITITLRNWYDANHALTVYVFECLFGTATGNGSALYQMK